MKIELDYAEFQARDGDKDLLSSLKLQPGWPIYQALLKRKFVLLYSKLRTTQEKDKLDDIRGQLEGLEYALGVLDEEINVPREE